MWNGLKGRIRTDGCPGRRNMKKRCEKESNTPRETVQVERSASGYFVCDHKKQDSIL